MAYLQNAVPQRMSRAGPYRDEGEGLSVAHGFIFSPRLLALLIKIPTCR